MPNAYVFAGGALDLNDESADVYALCDGLDDGLASEQLELPSNGLRFFVAAVREAFEECGLLLAYDARGEIADLSSWDESHLRETRLKISAGRLTFAELCRAQGWRLAVDKLAFFSHWITPPGSVRFDTRFFLCGVPPHQTASLAGNEMSQLVWRTAAEALAEHAGQEIAADVPDPHDIERNRGDARYRRIVRLARRATQDCPDYAGHASGNSRRRRLRWLRLG